MKKIWVAALVIAVLFTMTACAAKYKDGTYTGEGAKRQYGYENAIVTIKGGKIDSVVLKRLDTTGKEVDYTDWSGKPGVDGTTKPNLKQFKIDMAKSMVEKQSSDVDTISSATDSSKGWKVAVENALKKAK